MGAGRPSKGQAVVVVDDDPSWRAVMQLALRRAGYRVRLVADPRRALAVVTDLAPAAVLVDFSMPHLNGLELAELLHGRLGAACPPLLGVTGSIEEVEASPSRDLLALTLPKPVPLTTLLTELHRVIAGRTRSGVLPAFGDPHPQDRTREAAEADDDAASG